jgi:beta-lactam-binding protein with PASTA domain
MILGHSIQRALAILSEHNLNGRIIDVKEDNDLPDGTILAQSPCSKSKIKRNHTVFLVVSQKQEAVRAPDLIGKKIDHLQENLKKERISNKAYIIDSQAPAGYCIAQIPAPGQPLQQRSLVTYIASSARRPVIFPDLKNVAIEAILTLLKPYGITPVVFHKTPPDGNHNCSACVVIDQKPLAGSIVTLSEKLIVQLLAH